ncbi:hypothetical protein [Herbidospora mongoliensis]|uniref:hypothetical protein n=1 Tax=Herbidospora mongoliensis TaxID=688067 RepID=UPI000836F5D5|nr:hypothetical protein [Herbidospora mongoliensis]
MRLTTLAAVAALPFFVLTTTAPAAADPAPPPASPGFLPGLSGGGMAMPMSGMPGDPLIAISGFEDKLLGNKPH